MSESTDKMTQEVHDTEGVIDSAVTLITGIAAKLRDAAGDAGAVTALADELDAKRQQLADAVAANQPTS